jgi:hypothetical protein
VVGWSAAVGRRNGNQIAMKAQAVEEVLRLESRDLFDGAKARAKMSYVVFAVNIVPMMAPAVGAALC